jgi:competence protein ComFC
VESVWRAIKITFNWLLEILFPSICLGCQIKGEILCPSCIAKVHRAEKEIEHPDIMAVFEYHDPLVKKVIWNLKYYHHPYLGQKLGEIIYDELLEDMADIKIYTAGSPILVIPVPISKKKTKIRGYNQAKKIAQGFCQRGGKKIFNLRSNIISKKIETIPQARITNRERRLKNIRGAFAIKNPELVRNQTIIVIDDVTTTGGTIGEIIKILKKAGAKKVIGLAVAH